MNALINHIKKFVLLQEQEEETINGYFKMLICKKKQNLLVEGEVCKEHYFVEKGILRMFYINEKGVEHTTQFALENWWITDHTSFQKQQPSNFYIQVVEAATVWSIDAAAQENMLTEFPAMEKYFRIIYQRAYAAHQFRIKYIHDLTSEGRYDIFAGKNPDFIQRIPQYLLASYLGFTPEYLSELRRKKMG